MFDFTPAQYRAIFRIAGIAAACIGFWYIPGATNGLGFKLVVGASLFGIMLFFSELADFPRRSDGGDGPKEDDDMVVDADSSQKFERFWENFGVEIAAAYTAAFVFLLILYVGLTNMGAAESTSRIFDRMLGAGAAAVATFFAFAIVGRKSRPRS